MGLDAGAALEPHGVAFCGIFEERADLLGHRGVISHRDEIPAIAVDDNSGMPPALVATTGLPAAMASTTTWPKGSGVGEAWTRTVSFLIRSFTLSQKPVNSTLARPSSFARVRTSVS